MKKSTWDKLDELFDWHATFPNKTPGDVIALWSADQVRAETAEAHNKQLIAELTRLRDIVSPEDCMSIDAAIEGEYEMPKS